MQHYNFIATDQAITLDFMKIESFIDLFPDFQTVALVNDKELEALLELIDIKYEVHKKTRNSIFTKYWDISNYLLPVIDEQEFDDLFRKWLEITNKESDMNEYGNLIFLLGKSKEWNMLKHRYVVKEEKNT